MKRLLILAGLILAGLWLRSLADQTITIPGQTVTIAPQTFTVRTPGLNVRDFGAVPNDGQDDTAAFEAAIAAVPAVDDAWNSWNRPSNGEVIYVPSGLYEFSREIAWPAARKSVTFVSADHGARLKTAVNYVTTIPAGDRAVAFDGIIFDGCGVAFAGGSRIAFGFRNCLFEGAKDYAVKALGPSVHEVTITDCMFSACAGAILQAPTCENWHIERCRFWRCGGAFGNVCLQSTTTTLANCDFEAAPDNYPLGYVTVLNGPMTLDGLRFGNESTTGFRAAPFCVMVGLPAGLMGAPANPTYVQGLRVRGCYATGSVGTGLPSSASGNGVVQLNVPVCDCVVSDCVIAKHAGNIIDESPLTSPQFSYGNVWRDNAVAVTHAAGVFSADGIGFGILPQGNVYDTTLNLSLPTFAKTAGVLVDQSPGTVWYRVTIDSQGDFLRYMHGAGINANQVVAEIEAVAGTLDKLRFDLFDDTTGKAVTSVNDTRRFSKTRERLTVVGKWTPGNKLSLFVRPGDANAAAGTVFVARPSLRYSNVVQ